MALALHWQFEQSQWFTPERLLEIQMQQLGELLRHARQHVPSYRERIKCAEIDPAVPLNLEAFRRLPVLRRADVQAAGKALFSLAPPRQHGKAIPGRSSGSTGRPVEYISNELCQLFWRTLTLREHFWHQRDFGGKLAVIRAGVKTADMPGWGPSTDVAFATGPSACFDIHSDLDAQAAWLQAQDPDYLLAYPSTLLGLAQLYQAGRFRLTRIKALRSFGEAFDTQARQYCRDAFQVPIADTYSASEVGYIALQCPLSGHYHIQSETVFAEVLRDDGEPCEAGETGRIVVTPLHNFSMPLIRYEIGDHVRLGGACPCGRGLLVIEQILGRQRNLLTLPDGRRFWPFLHMMEWPLIAPVLQAQAVQKSLREIEIRLVLARPMREDEQARLAEFILGHLPQAFNLRFSFHDAIAKSASGKFEDFLSEISVS
jgi:phenylacetate-CoA ligase